MRFSFLNHDFVASAGDRRELRLKRELKMVIEKWKVLYRAGGDSSERGDEENYYFIAYC